MEAISNFSIFTKRKLLVNKIMALGNQSPLPFMQIKCYSLLISYDYNISILCYSLLIIYVYNLSILCFTYPTHQSNFYPLFFICSLNFCSIPSSLMTTLWPSLHYKTITCLHSLCFTLSKRALLTYLFHGLQLC